MPKTMCSGTLWETKASSLLCVSCPSGFEPACYKKNKNKQRSDSWNCSYFHLELQKLHTDMFYKHIYPTKFVNLFFRSSKKAAAAFLQKQILSSNEIAREQPGHLLTDPDMAKLN